MKLDKLNIADFKNLRDFSINFDESSQTTVIVGRNGTGKSNLLEALIIIFRDLDLHAPPLFKYELEYLCRGRRVRVDADPERSKETVRITVDDEPLSYKRFTQQGEQRYLPSYVFGYYSGPSNRMEMHFEKHQERFYRDLLRNVDKPLRPLLYARLVHSQFVLLSFFNEQD
jgi:energy-coupling factor transporter ATP-binding protein EcfA2